MTSTHPPQEIAPAKTVAQVISHHAFGLQSIVSDVLEVHETEEDAILALERDGLANALQLVRPMSMIRRLPMDSPMRQLSIFQMTCLYDSRESTMRQVIDFLDEELRRGIRSPISIKEGVKRIALSALKARADLERQRRGNTGTRCSKQDLYVENGTIRQKLDTYEAFLSDLAAQAGEGSIDSLIQNFYNGGANEQA